MPLSLADLFAYQADEAVRTVLTLKDQKDRKRRLRLAQKWMQAAALLRASTRYTPQRTAPHARSRCHARRQHHSRPHRKTHRPARTPPAWLVRRRSSVPHKQRPPEAERPYKEKFRCGGATSTDPLRTLSSH